EARFVDLIGRGHGVDGFAVLDRDHAPGGEARAVANAVDLVEDRPGRVAAAQKVAVHRMHHAAADGAARGRKRLRDDLSAEDALQAVVGAGRPEQIALYLLEVEDAEEVGERTVGGAFGGMRHRLSLPVTAGRRVAVKPATLSRRRRSPEVEWHVTSTF